MSEVLLFTASGTFRGQRGTIQKREAERVLVLPEGERLPLWFSPREVVPAHDAPRAMVAGD